MEVRRGPYLYSPVLSLEIDTLFERTIFAIQSRRISLSVVGQLTDLVPGLSAIHHGVLGSPSTMSNRPDMPNQIALRVSSRLRLKSDHFKIAPTSECLEVDSQ